MKLLTAFILPLMAVSVIFCPVAARAGAVSFSHDIRPLLAENCLKCHGGVKEAGKLNLQFRDRALTGGASKLPAIVPGHPETSELMKRLTSTDDDERMPKKLAPLKPAQIAVLKQWIAEGANWEKHWAYIPPRRNGKTIDGTVAARLKHEGLSLSPEADRWILARRTALDVTGLPARLEDVEAFVKDSAPDAYERWVDKLLASPAYGERWAANWLDLARYADSKGYEKDGFRDMWRYRDWVIDAFNRDEPYDQFITDQLAGDLLPNPTDEQIIATAFHRNTQANEEGGVDREEFRTYAVLDRLNTTFEVLQGTTIACVQCHGHPYDPFVHDEYYKLLAFFNNTADYDPGSEAPTQKFYARTDEARADELKKKIEAAGKELDTEVARDENRKAFDAWLETLRATDHLAAPANLKVTSTKGKYNLHDDRVLLEGTAPETTTITLEGETTGTVGEIRLEMLPDDSLPNHGPGTGDAGNFVLAHLHVASVGADGTETPVEIASAEATHEQEGFPVSNAIKTNKDAETGDKRGWAIGGGTGEAQSATFHFTHALEAVAGNRLRVVLEFTDMPAPQHVPGSFRLLAGQAPVSTAFAALPDKLKRIAGKKPARWKMDERTALERHFFSAYDERLKKLYATRDEDRKELDALPLCNLLIMHELSGKDARVTHVFHRGNWMDKDEAVEPATPNILNPWPADAPTNRLGLAKWLTNGENPLTARVEVNRVWEQLFGIGLVETLEDFGTQGDAPVYQDLLDDLAARFQTDMKWSQKALVREILLSRVYRQSSHTSEKLESRDPANRLLGRGPRFRLTSEQIRDQALATGGLLDAKMFGPPVMPYQPPGMWLTPYEGHDWETAKDGNGHRRAIYTFIRRSACYPSFLTFDSPSREFCLARRTRTNTPLQSLDLLDSPVYFEAAEGLAKRMEAEGGTDRGKQIARGLFLATQRPPSADEVAVLKRLNDRVGGDLKLVANAILNLDGVLNKN